MNWKDLGKQFAGVGLPLLANAIAPGSGSIVALVAHALGLAPDAKPDEIAAAAANPDALLKLRELQDRHEEVLVKAAYDAETAAIQAVNATLQADARGDSWLQKNHHAIESLAATFSVVAIYFLLPLFKLPVPNVPEFAWMMLAAILGVTSWQHGMVNRTIAQNQGGENGTPAKP
jgi:hypothetical protein